MPKIRGIKPEFWTDEDICDLTIPARLLFMGLWTYACDNGHLQDKSKQIKMRILPADDCNVAELLRELEGKGRIIRANGWIIVPNFTKHQKPDKRYFQTCEKDGCERPPADSQPGTRGGHDESTARPHGGLVGGSMGPHVDGDGEGEMKVKVMVNESGADAPEVPSTSLAIAERPDVEEICTHLADRIEGNGAKRPTITAKWRDAARLMLDRDNLTEAEIHGAIEWSQRDEFWRANVLSLPKLREKYDQLRLQAQRQQRGPQTHRQAAEDAMWERAYARAEARDQ